MEIWNNHRFIDRENYRNRDWNKDLIETSKDLMTRIETVDPNWIEIFRMTAIGLFEIETLRVQEIWIYKIEPKRLEKLNF